MNEQKHFASLKEAAALTGLKVYWLRAGCQNGTIPHIKSGIKYLVNVPALLEMLDEQSKAGMEPLK